MKDELGGKVMTEFVALRAKMYAYRKLDEEKPECKRCKGTKKCVVKEALTFEDYKTCLFEGKTLYREQVLFEHKKHDVYTVCLLYTSPSPRDGLLSRMPSSA